MAVIKSIRKCGKQYCMWSRCIYCTFPFRLAILSNHKLMVCLFHFTHKWVACIVINVSCFSILTLPHSHTDWIRSCVFFLPFTISISSKHLLFKSIIVSSGYSIPYHTLAHRMLYIFDRVMHFSALSCECMSPNFNSLSYDFGIHAIRIYSHFRWHSFDRTYSFPLHHSGSPVNGENHHFAVIVCSFSNNNAAYIRLFTHSFVNDEARCFAGDSVYHTFNIDWIFSCHLCANLKSTTQIEWHKL